MRRLPMLVAAALIALGAPAPGADPLADDVRPDPMLGPGQVVRAQLEALRRNGADDRGIEVAFRFASPSNRRATGPLERFARMIKDGPYAPMLRFTDAAYGAVEIDGARATQRVTLFAPGREPASYEFVLLRQRGGGELDGCWMTEGVRVVPTHGTQA